MSAVEQQVVGRADPVVVKLRGVAKQYKRGSEVVPVLEKLDLDLPRSLTTTGSALPTACSTAAMFVSLA